MRIQIVIFIPNHLCDLGHKILFVIRKAEIKLIFMCVKIGIIYVKG